MVKGIIFDMDGTVVCSTDSDYEAFKKAFKEYNVDFTYQEYIDKVGAKGEDIVKSKVDLDDTTIEKLLVKKNEGFKSLVRAKGLKAVDGVEEFLLDVKAFPLWTALATGSKKDKVDFVFDNVKLEQYFDVVLTADDVSEGKPDPNVFLKAAKKLKLKPSECIVFEDAVLGIKAAKKAGMRVVAITTSSPKEMLSEADLVIDSFKDFDLSDFMEKATLEA